MLQHQRVAGGDRRKRSRTAAPVVVPFDDEEDDAGSAEPCTYASTPAPAAPFFSHLVTDGRIACAAPPTLPPPEGAFLCPLTLSIMYDPVLDLEGNSFERSAILAYLKDHSISPLSRKPLHPGRIIPNHALRELIHRCMGSEWVQRRGAELNQRSSYAKGPKSLPVAPSSCPCRAKMSRLLEALAPGELAGQGPSTAVGAPLRLTLNSEGSAALRCQGIVVVLDVPRGVGLFHLYTRNLVLNPSLAVQQRMLELNFLQGTCMMLLVGQSGCALLAHVALTMCTTHLYTGETRGGCLSIKRREEGAEGSSNGGSSCEVVFSYNDRVDEVTARDVRNILLNFVETALAFKAKFEKMMTMQATTSSALANFHEGL
jgi:U-box domain